MLARILPPSVEPPQLPQPRSEGARVMARYCVQCHYLPSPRMHTPERWRPVVERMVWRMQGRGNMGELMKDMMAGVEAPSPTEERALLAYLRRHGQAEIDPARYPDLDSRQGRLFSLACSQCHALPDPKRHSAKEWPKVVERMQKHMAWTNRIVAHAPDAPDELDVKSIVAFLQRNGRVN
jgi:mono/diheme cytochrome c family protein